MDSDVTRQAPGLVVPSSMVELRPGILATHEAQQANLNAVGPPASQSRASGKQGAGSRGATCYSNRSRDTCIQPGSTCSHAATVGPTDSVGGWRNYSGTPDAYQAVGNTASHQRR
eukprot:7817889-Pyramimonas_sp.AAC.1